jgi:GAF domain-containing protein
VSAVSRETLLLQTFARLADTLIDDFDVVDLLQFLVDSCKELLETAAAGILLADSNGQLELVASTSEASRLVEMMQLSAYAGPCVDSFTSGTTISVPDIARVPEEWWRFQASALEQGFVSACAIPLRLRETTIGTLNVLRTEPGDLPPHDLVAAKALADVATIGILQERAIRRSQVLSDQLQHALNSRVIIEQAKGVVAHSRKIDTEEAFEVIRGYSRSRQVSLSEVARQLVARQLIL